MDAAADPLTSCQGCFRSAAEQDREFVSANASDGIFLADVCANNLGHDYKSFIAACMFDIVNDAVRPRYKTKLENRSYAEGASHEGETLKEVLADRRKREHYIG